MFHGSVPADLRSIVHEHAAQWPDGDIWIGCSGNYTIERVLWDLHRPMHSNDVQGYSSALGWFLVDGKVPYTLQPESLIELEWLTDYLDEGIGTMATIMLGTTFLPYVGKKQTYYKRMLDGTKHQFADMHAKTVQRLTDLPLKLASYHAMDVREWLRDVVPPDDAVAMFPPFFAGDYESQFETIDQHFDWPKPDYPELDEKGKDELIQLITGRPNWVVGLHIEREELAPYLRGQVQTSNRGVPIYVYASGKQTRIVKPRQETAPIPMPKITRTGDLGDRMSIHVLNSGQFSMIRSQFMDRSIKPGSPLVACGVAVDGVLIGAFAYLPPKFDPRQAYLMSDFPVSWSKYKHLAKLVICAAMSHEAKMLVQRAISARVNTVATTAFSNNPVSMKYRGLFDLHGRRPADDGLHKFQLHYVAELGEWDLQEGLAMWKKRWGTAIHER